MTPDEQRAAIEEARGLIGTDGVRVAEILARLAKLDREGSGLAYDARMRWYEAWGAFEQSVGEDRSRVMFRAALAEIGVDRSTILECTQGCGTAPTWVDNKGYVYCASHGAQRRLSGTPARKLTAAEIARLTRGHTIRYGRG